VEINHPNREAQMELGLGFRGRATIRDALPEGDAGASALVLAMLADAATA
jgi:hypothetical protein